MNNTPDFSELVASLKRMSEAFAEADEKMQDLSRRITEIMPELDRRVIEDATHRNWPELCICDECEEMRKTISQISETVLPSSRGTKRT